MGQFQKLTDYKNNIMYKLITNEKLVKALVINEEDFLDRDLPENFSPASIIYSQIYPYQYVSSIESEPKTFITMSFGNYRYVNNCFKSGVLNFYVFTHKSLISKSNYGLRTDFIIDEVDSMFNKSDSVGVFKLELNSGGDIKLDDEYFGSVISYKFTDFQV